MKWTEGSKEGVIVAGGNGAGDAMNQFYYPAAALVDAVGTIYVSDRSNSRIMRWTEGDTEGSMVVGENGGGDRSDQLALPFGLSFDHHGHLYVVDMENCRVQRFDMPLS